MDERISCRNYSVNIYIHFFFFFFFFFFLFCISEAMAFVWECNHMSACLY